MPTITNEEKVVKGKKGKNVVQSGTTKPLPTADDVPKDPVKDAELTEMARAQNEALAKKKAEIEEKRAKLKALQEELKKEKDTEAAIKKAEKEAKDAEKNAAKKAREEAEARIKEADEAIAAAQKDLEATDEWKFLVAAKEARQAIGPLPKVRKGGGERVSGQRGPKGGAAGLSMTTVRVLRAMSDGVTRNGKEIGELSGILKGKRFPELYDAGLIDIHVPQEGERGRTFTITQAGLDALEKAEAALLEKGEEKAKASNEE